MINIKKKLRDLVEQQTSLKLIFCRESNITSHFRSATPFTPFTIYHSIFKCMLSHRVNNSVHLSSHATFAVRCLLFSFKKSLSHPAYIPRHPIRGCEPPAEPIGTVVTWGNGTAQWSPWFTNFLSTLFKYIHT